MLCPNDTAASGTTYAILQFVFLIGLCAGIAGCAVPETSIVSKPAGATVAINGVTVGTTPIHRQFDFKQTPTFNVVASKTGYLNEELILTKESPGIQDNQLTSSWPKMKPTRSPPYPMRVTTGCGCRWILPCHRMSSGKKSWIP